MRASIASLRFLQQRATKGRVLGLIYTPGLVPDREPKGANDMDADFAEFVAARQDGLLRFGTLLSGGDAATAADLVQDALLLLGRRWRHVDYPDAYARRTMTRLWWRRSRKYRREIPQADPSEIGATEHRPVWDSAVWSALQQLPPRQRAVSVLRYFEDCSEHEIATALSCRPGTVKSQASRGLAKLRVLLSTADEPQSVGEGSR